MTLLEDFNSSIVSFSVVENKPTLGALYPINPALPKTSIVTTGKNNDQNIELFLLKNILLAAIVKLKYIFISLLVNFFQSSL